MVLRARVHEAKPMVGMILAFKHDPSHPLGAIPAKIIYVWPRFRSGDYLVTLEYDQPIKFKNEFITRIDAFMSELQPSY